MRRAVLLMGVVLIGAVPGMAGADPVYRWNDSSGAVSYGEKPPANALNVRLLDVKQGTVVSSNQDADQKLADAYTKSRMDRLQQETAEARLATERARADAIRQQAALDAARAQALANCSSNWSASCGDSDGPYYPVVGVRRDAVGNGDPGYPGYRGNPGFPAGGTSGQPARPGYSPGNLPVPPRSSTVTLSPARPITLPN